VTKSIFLVFYVAFIVDFIFDALLPDVLFRHPCVCLTVTYNATLWVYVFLFFFLTVKLSIVIWMEHIMIIHQFWKILLNKLRCTHYQFSVSIHIQFPLVTADPYYPSTSISNFIHLWIIKYWINSIYITDSVLTLTQTPFWY
jgi:hypothetical protein